MSASIDSLVAMNIITRQQLIDLERNRKDIIDVITNNEDVYALFVDKILTVEDLIKTRPNRSFLKNDKGDFGEITPIGTSQIEVLENPEILNFIKNNKIKFGQILNLDSHQIKILNNSVVLDFLRKDKINFDQILDLTVGQIEILKNPVVLDFLRRDKINFEQILNIKSSQVSVLKNPEMLAFIKNETIQLDQILNLKPYQIQILNNSAIFNLVKNEKIQLDQILSIKIYQVEILNNLLALNILGNDKSNFDLILKLENFQVSTLGNPIILYFLKNDITQLNNLSQLDLSQVEALRNQTISKLLSDNKIGLDQIEIAQLNQYQIEVLTDPKIAIFFKDKDGKINLDQLLKIDNVFQVDTIKKAHIQTLLKNNIIKIDQLLEIKDEQLYNALINPFIAKILRDKMATFDDIVQEKANDVDHCTITLDEFLSLCSGDSKEERVPLWFKNALSDRGIKIFVTDTESDLDFSSIGNSLKNTTAIFNKECLNKRKSFGPYCTIVALDSNDKLLGYSILEFCNDRVELHNLASASQSSEAIENENKEEAEERAKAFSYIGSFLFAASTIACIGGEGCGKNLTWISVADSFYDKFRNYGVTNIGYNYTTEKINDTSDIAPGRDFFKKLPFNISPLNEDRKSLPIQIIADSSAVKKSRDKALKDVDVVCSMHLTKDKDVYKTYLIYDQRAEQKDISSWRKNIETAIKDKSIADNSYVYKYDPSSKSLLFVYVQDGIAGKAINVTEKTESDNLEDIITALDIQKKNVYELLKPQAADTLTIKTKNPQSKYSWMNNAIKNAADLQTQKDAFDKFQIKISEF